MRLNLIYILMLISSIQLLGSPHGNGQNLDKIEVTVEMEYGSLTALLAQIEEQTSLKFAYAHYLVSGVHVKLSKKTDSVKNILEEALSHTGLSYRVVENKSNNVVIYKRLEGLQRREFKPQKVVITGSISGVVTEAETGEPLVGANVFIKGTTKGIATNVEGRYTLDGLEPNMYTVVVTFLGFERVEREVNVMDGEVTTLNIAMKETIGELGEVEVNAGYYSVSDRNRTGNISRVTAAEVERQPVTNVLQALQARMPGVEITQESGIPGAGMRIRIRGQNSIRSEANYPLYIIDGVPVSSVPIRSEGGSFGNGTVARTQGIDPLNTLDPNNIESIEILKDADATAIYGSRGANGVVLITTKKGRAGKTSLDVSVESGAGKVSNMMDLLNTAQYLEMRNEAFTNDGVTPTESNAPDLLLWDTTRDVDWQKELFGGTASYTDMQASVSGGTDQTSYRISGSFHNQTTVLPGDSRYNRASVQFHANHTSEDQKFRMSLSANYGVDNNRLFGGTGDDIVRSALTLPPNAPPLYDEDGNLNWAVDQFGSPTFENPVALLKRTQEVAVHNLVSSAVFRYEVLPGLEVKTSLGYTDFTLNDVMIDPLSSYDPFLLSLGFLEDQTFVSNQTNNSWIIEPQVIYNTAFGDSRLDVLAGTTWQESSSTGRLLRGEGYLSEELLGSLNPASQVSLGYDSNSLYRYNAIFGRIGYNWKEKYLLNLTGRRDGSSRFGEDRKFGNFGAVGAAWIFSEEPFMTENLSFISFGKLRASYGTTGNDQIGDYGYLDTYRSIELGNSRGDGGLNPVRLANSDYRWEMNRKLEAALELGLVEDRVLVAASWYRNRSSSQLIGLPLPSITGFTSVQANLLATVQNTGWELEMTARNIQSGNFYWTTSVNLTIPRNELLEYPDFEESPYANTLVLGEPLTIQKQYQYVGVDPTTGLYQVLDVNEDGLINQDDRISIVDQSRKYYGGLQNTLQYKRWELDFLIEFVNQKGRDYFLFFGNSIAPPGMYNPGFSAGNVPIKVWENRWQQPGDETDVQKFTQSFANLTPYNRASTSNHGYVDASFIRLKNISLSYQFPPDQLAEASIYIRAQNLFTWTDYFGLDPQNPYGGLPALKMITGGVQLRF